MTIQLIFICVNVILIVSLIRKARRIANATTVLTGLRKQIESEYERLQSISTDIDRHGKSIHLKIGLDEIDIDRVRDDATRNYLAFRKLIKDFNPN